MEVKVKELKITRGEVATLSAIIGKCAIKNIGNDLFLPMIKLKAACSANVIESQELLKKIHEENGIAENSKTITFAMRKNLAEQETKLHQDVAVGFIDTRILTTEQLMLLHEENPTLTTSELEVLFKWLVKN